MKRRECASLIILALAAVPALLVAIGQVYVTGVDGIRLRRTETIYLLTEIAVLFFLYLFTIWKIESNRIRTGAVLLITAGFLWIHQAFTAMILSGAYVLVLLMLGARIRRGMDREHRWREYHVITGLADFLLGSGFMIGLFCLGSLFFGCGITSFRFLTVVIAGLLAGYRMMELRAAGDSGMPWKRVPQRTRISLEMSICIALMFAMILLQAGRMNICADYDSLHYGLRNEYVLDNGGGIYENLGMVNVVYTYSKGLETLLLPISGLPSYGFFLSFQIWMTVGTLIAAGQIVELFVGRRYAVRCMTLLSCIPGIMNMSITAKTDSMTVFMQLVLLLFLLLYIRRQRSAYLVLAVAFYTVLAVQGTFPLSYLPIYIAAAYLVWMLLLLGREEQRVLRYLKSDESLLGTEYVLRFDAGKLSVEVPEKKLRNTVALAKLASAIEISSVFMLCLTADQLYLVPTAAMTDEQRTALRGLLSSRLGERFYSSILAREKKK